MDGLMWILQNTYQGAVGGVCGALVSTILLTAFQRRRRDRVARHALRHMAEAAKEWKELRTKQAASNALQEARDIYDSILAAEPNDLWLQDLVLASRFRLSRLVQAMDSATRSSGAETVNLLTTIHTNAEWLRVRTENIT